MGDSAMSISGEGSTFGIRRVTFISCGPLSDSFQTNNHLKQNMRGGIATPRALEVESTFQPLKFNSERALTLADVDRQCNPLAKSACCHRMCLTSLFVMFNIFVMIDCLCLELSFCHFGRNLFHRFFPSPQKATDELG